MFIRPTMLALRRIRKFHHFYPKFGCGYSKVGKNLIRVIPSFLRVAQTSGIQIKPIQNGG